jgi:importin subunit beta-1
MDSNVNNLRISAYEALMELIKNSPADCYPVVQQTTIVILTKLESLLSIEDALISSNERSQLRDLQSQLCATLQSVLHKIRVEDAPLISDAIMTGLLRIMTRCGGKECGAVIEEALMAITALIEGKLNSIHIIYPSYIFSVKIRLPKIHGRLQTLFVGRFG